MSYVVKLVVSAADSVLWLYETGRDWWYRITKITNWIADVLHWETIGKIHKIAYIVSSDYHAMWRGIMVSVRNASAAIGRDADFLSQLLIASKSVVYSAAALGGYTIGEAEGRYLARVDNFFRNFNWRAETYRDHPERLFTDAEIHLFKPDRDIARDAGRSLFIRARFAVEGVQRLTTDLADFNKSLQDLENALPEKMRSSFHSLIGPVLDALDFTETTAFDEYVVKIDKVLNIIGQDIEAQKTDFGGLVAKLLLPGQWLLDLTHLDDLARGIEESRMATAASKTLRDGVEDLTTLAQPISMVLEKLSGALKIRIPPVEWAVPEVEVPRPGHIEAIEPALTWFVGDY